MRKKVWEQSKGYDCNAYAYEDWSLNLSAYESGWDFYYIPEVMYEYRVRENSMLRTVTNYEETQNYIARKHGAIYMSEFKRNFTIMQRIKILISDIWHKITGNPQY